VRADGLRIRLYKVRSKCHARWVTTESEQTHWSVAGLLELFDARADGPDRFTADTGIAAEDERQVVEGTQVLAQVIVAVAKRFPEKSVRSAHAVFSRAVLVGPPVEFDIDVVAEGRSTATAVVSVSQNGRRAITVTALLDVPTDDVIRHQLSRPEVAAPADANDSPMPIAGRELRLVDVVDVNSPDEVGPPELYAWLHYDPIPARDDLAKALIAYFTGHLGISTTMRAHEGIGTSQSHLTVSTAPLTVTVSFHEPVTWTGWLLYTHESTQVGAGMSYVRGAVHTEEGELIASFAQEALIRPLRTSDSAIKTQARL
jgi:acyl-CoA thioesterase II